MKKRCLSILFAALFLILPGCKAAQNTATVAVDQPPALEQEPPTWQKNTEPITMTFHSESTIPQDSPAMGDWPLWGEDPVSRHIQNLTGVKLVELNENIDISLSVVMASNEWGDFYQANGVTANFVLEDATLSYSLDELAEKYCPDFWDGADELEMLNNTADDGHIYTLRSKYYDNAVYDDERIPIYPKYSTVINTKWLEKIESDMPTSIEELEECLVKVKDLGMGITPFNLGDAITSPIASWMGLYEDTYWDDEAKSIRTPLRQNGWLEYLQLMNRWYREELLALPTLEQKQIYDSYDTEYDFNAFYMRWCDMNDYLQGRSSIAFATSFDTDYLEYAVSLDKGSKAKDEFKWQVITEPLTWQGEKKRIAQDNAAYRGHRYGLHLNYGSGLFITKACTNPERAIAFYQFLKSDEGSHLTHWGIEGTHYTLNEQELPIYLEEHRANIDSQWYVGLDNRNERFGLDYWSMVPNHTCRQILKTIPEICQNNPDVICLYDQTREAGLSYKKEARDNKCPVIQLAEPVYGSDEYNDYMAVYHSWLNGMEAIIVEATDAVDVQSRWEALKAELRTLGLDNFEKSMTVRFAEELERYHKAGYYTEIQP